MFETQDEGQFYPVCTKWVELVDTSVKPFGSFPHRTRSSQFADKGER